MATHFSTRWPAHSVAPSVCIRAVESRLGGANFAPFFHPDGKRLIFASNFENPRGRNFDLFIVRTDGTGLEKVTTSGEFDGFPMFSPDGRKLVFASNRHGKTAGETDLFIADWKE